MLANKAKAAPPEKPVPYYKWHPALLSNDQIRASEIVEIVCGDFAIKPQEIAVRNGHQPFLEARHSTFYLLRQITGFSSKSIGEWVASYDESAIRYDHSSVLHGIKRVEEQLFIEKKQTKKPVTDKINTLATKIQLRLENLSLLKKSEQVDGFLKTGQQALYESKSNVSAVLNAFAARRNFDTYMMCVVFGFSAPVLNGLLAGLAVNISADDVCRISAITGEDITFKTKRIHDKIGLSGAQDTDSPK